MNPYSKQARAKQKAVAEKDEIAWSDFFGLFEPNPHLPDCQSTQYLDGPQCQRKNHHKGKHKARLQW